MKHLPLLLMTCMAFFQMQAQMVSVTFNVNMANETTSPDGVYLAGGEDWGGPGANNPNLMTDEDGDDIWTITVEVESGYTGLYTFTNGTCGADWSCKENIVGQPCAAGEWSDRELVNITEDTIINTCFGQCTTDGSCTATGGPVDVTFHVDMANENVTNTVYMVGDWISWSEWANPMEDADGDGIYTLTLECLPGAIQWKYLIDGDWDTAETFDGSESCTTAPGEYVNRLLIVEGSDPIVLDAICYNGCDACGEVTPCIDSLQIDTTMMCTTEWAPVCGCDGVTYGNECEAQFYGGVTSWTDGECSTASTVTFQVDMSEQDILGPIYITGQTIDNWDGTSVVMNDIGDGIYAVNVELDAGDHEFKFNNGDWDGTENLDSQEDSMCTLTTIDGEDTFVNRIITIAPGAGNVVLDPICFESCEECEEVVVPDTEVTFHVDMSSQTVDGDVYVTGPTIDNWEGETVLMSDADGDNVYSVTLNLPQGDHEYKFMNGSWSAPEQLDAQADSACTITSAGFTNRILTISSEDAMVLDTVCFESCAPCLINHVAERNPLQFRVFPSVTDGVLTVAFPAATEADANLVVRDLSGRQVCTENFNAGSVQTVVDLGNQPNGFYIIRVKNGAATATETVIVQH